MCQCVPFLGPLVPEQYCRPSGLYKTDRVDLKKLKALVQEGQLVPCFPGTEEAATNPEYERAACVLLQILRKRKGVEVTDKLRGAVLKEGEACPVCFLTYPALNTSGCCGKRLCTDCYLQVRHGRGAVPATATSQLEIA
jgi:hypothetical protein